MATSIIMDRSSVDAYRERLRQEMQEDMRKHLAEQATISNPRLVRARRRRGGVGGVADPGDGDPDLRGTGAGAGQPPTHRHLPSIADAAPRCPRLNVRAGQGDDRRVDDDGGRIDELSVHPGTYRGDGDRQRPFRPEAEGRRVLDGRDRHRFDDVDRVRAHWLQTDRPLDRISDESDPPNYRTSRGPYPRTIDEYEPVEPEIRRPGIGGRRDAPFDRFNNGTGHERSWADGDHDERRGARFEESRRSPPEKQRHERDVPVLPGGDVLGFRRELKRQPKDEYAEELRRQMAEQQERKRREKQQMLAPAADFQGRAANVSWSTDIERKSANDNSDRSSAHFADRDAEKKSSYHRELDEQVRRKKERERDQMTKGQREDEKKEQELSPYNPWGKAGAGAPLRHGDGSVVVNPKAYLAEMSANTPRPAEQSSFQHPLQAPSEHAQPAGTQGPCWGAFGLHGAPLVSPPGAPMLPMSYGLPAVSGHPNYVGYPGTLSPTAGISPLGMGSLGQLSSPAAQAPTALPDVPNSNPVLPPIAGQEAPGASTTTAAPTSSTAATMAKTFFRGSADTLPDWAKEQRIQKQAAYREMQEALKQQIAEKERARMEVKAREQEEEAREMERMQLERQALDAHFRAEIEQEQRQAEEIANKKRQEKAFSNRQSSSDPPAARPPGPQANLDRPLSLEGITDAETKRALAKKLRLQEARNTAKSSQAPSPVQALPLRPPSPPIRVQHNAAAAALTADANSTPFPSARTARPAEAAAPRPSFDETPVERRSAAGEPLQNATNLVQSAQLPPVSAGVKRYDAVRAEARALDLPPDNQGTATSSLTSAGGPRSPDKTTVQAVLDQLSALKQDLEQEQRKVEQDLLQPRPLAAGVFAGRRLRSAIPLAAPPIEKSGRHEDTHDVVNDIFDGRYAKTGDTPAASAGPCPPDDLAAGYFRAKKLHSPKPTPEPAYALPRIAGYGGVLDDSERQKMVEKMRKQQRRLEEYAGEHLGLGKEEGQDALRRKRSQRKLWSAADGRDTLKPIFPDGLLGSNSCLVSLDDDDPERLDKRGVARSGFSTRPASSLSRAEIAVSDDALGDGLGRPAKRGPFAEPTGTAAVRRPPSGTSTIDLDAVERLNDERLKKLELLEHSDTPSSDLLKEFVSDPLPARRRPRSQRTERSLWAETYKLAYN